MRTWLDHFDVCVSHVLGDDLTFKFDAPPSCQDPEPGCLKSAWLDDVDCDVDSVSLTPGSACTEAPHQPPPSIEPECPLPGGSVEVSDGTSSLLLDIEDGTVKYSNFYCEVDGCPFVIQQFDVAIESFYIGDDLVHDITASLQTPAVGQSDGEKVLFAPGSFWVEVSASVTDAAGTTPFTGVTNNANAAFAHFNDGKFLLEELTFEVEEISLQGSFNYTFDVNLDEADCVSALPFDWTELDLSPYDEVVARWIAVNPGDDDVLYVGHSEGVLVSEDGGDSWDVLTTLAVSHRRKFVFDPQDPSIIYIASGLTIWVYDPVEEDFQQLDEQISAMNGSISLLHVSPADGSIYAAMRTLLPGVVMIYKREGGQDPFAGYTISSGEYEDPIDPQALFASGSVGVCGASAVAAGQRSEAGR